MNDSWIIALILMVPLIMFGDWITVYGPMSDDDVASYVSVVEMRRGSDNAIAKMSNFNPTHPTPFGLWIACSIHGVEIIMSSSGVIDATGKYHGQNIPAMTTKDVEFETPPKFALRPGETTHSCVVAATREKVVKIAEFVHY